MVTQSDNKIVTHIDPGSGLRARGSGHSRIPPAGPRSDSNRIATRCKDHAQSTMIVRLTGDEVLRQVIWQTKGIEDLEIREIENVFVMIHASPNTEWLNGVVELDSTGFVSTDAARGSSYATSVSGLFAVGDVRACSTKRVPLPQERGLPLSQRSTRISLSNENWCSRV